MPKFIGRTIPGSIDLEDLSLSDRRALTPLVSITYSQAKLLQSSDVYYMLNTSDRGAPGLFAKRWNDWYAQAETILASSAATENMKQRAAAVLNERQRIGIRSTGLTTQGASQ